jgi:hypothetical protein
LKIAAGIAYALFYSQPQYIQGSDTWRFFNASKDETDWLLRDPAGFIKDLFTYGYQQSGNLFNAKDSFWNDLKSNVIIKLMAVCNLLSLKNYYADIIFFNFFFFFGPVAFYRVAKEQIRANKIVLIAFVFCIPSFLFWCSGMHKDGLIFMSVALIVFYFNKWLRQKKVRFTTITIWLICMILLFSLRNFVLFLLLPALLTWFLCFRYPRKKWLIVFAVYGLGLTAFFAARLIMPNLDFPAYVVSKQNEFKLLGGNSQLALPLLEPDFMSFVKFLPSAIDIAFLRPHVTETINMAYWLSIAENIFLYALILAALFSIFIAKNNYRQLFPATQALIIFCLCFALSNLLLSGYTITLTGAMVRYRSFALPFLITPLLSLIHISKKKIRQP